jgi:lipopolysaccharide biosynthesis glycosyltransferase
MRHASNIKIVHFIGSKKPWDFDRFPNGEVVPMNSMPNQTLEMLKEWWHVFDFLKLEQKGFANKVTK